MATSKTYYILILFAGFFSCKTQGQPAKTKIFTVETASLESDTVLTSAVYFGGRIFCLQANHKIFVLDTLLQKDYDLTAKFSEIKADFIHPSDDTIFIGTRKDLYFLDEELMPRKYNLQRFRDGLPYYEDETYDVHACSAGEWGGAVFFWDKRAGSTYSYPATDVQQVLKFSGSYVVSSYLSHMSGISDYLFIKDPTELYQLQNGRPKKNCNWYMAVDSIKGKKLFDTATPPGVKYYSDNFITRTLVTFPYKDELYSIYCTDRATILAKFHNSRLVPLDTLLSHELTFSDTKTHLAESAVVTAYKATWAMGDHVSTIRPYQNTGLIVIRNNKIIFVQIQTPHMWTNDRR